MCSDMSRRLFIWVSSDSLSMGHALSVGCVDSTIVLQEKKKISIRFSVFFLTFKFDAVTFFVVDFKQK